MCPEDMRPDDSAPNDADPVRDLRIRGEQTLMGRLEEALARLGNAVENLAAAIDAAEVADQTSAVTSSELPVLLSERDELAEEVKALRARAAEDAELRAEAALAVREALNDLRGVVQGGASSHA